MLGIPPNVSDDAKLLTYCCVSGCKINSRSNPDIIFHVLNTENLTFQNTKNCKIQELKICNEHYFSTDPLTLSVENITSSPSDIITPTFEVVPTNYDPITNFFDTAPSPSQTEIDANMPEINLTEDLTNNDLEICRVCLLDGNLKNIDTEVVNNNLIKDMLQKFNYLNCPNFPKKICENCLHDLIISYNFLIRFENSTKHLIYTNSNFAKSVEKETFPNSQNKIDKFELDEINDKYDLMINFEKNKRSIDLLEKFTKENLIKLKRQIEKKDIINEKIITTTKKRNSRILKEIYKNRILISMQFKTKNRINNNRKLKGNVTEKVSNKTQSKLTNEMRKKSNQNKQINVRDKNKKVNKENARKTKVENMPKSTKLQFKNEFPKSEKPSFELPAEMKKRIIDKTKPYSQKQKLEKLVELFKLANPFLTNVIINENFKESNGEKNKRHYKRKVNLKTTKNRVLIATTAQIQEIIENNIFPNKIKLENTSEKALFFAQAYPCSSCDKCFLSEDFVNRHYCEAEEKNRFILETKDWKCEICLNVFDDLQLLIAHHCLDTFKCKRCPDRYVTIDEIKLHIARKHPLSDPMKFQCEFCGKEYKKQSYVKEHMLNLHYEFYVLPTKEKTRNC